MGTKANLGILESSGLLLPECGLKKPDWDAARLRLLIYRAALSGEVPGGFLVDVFNLRALSRCPFRAGLRHILFTVQPEEVPLAMDEYLKSLEPVPSPHRVNGGLALAAQDQTVQAIRQFETALRLQPRSTQYPSA